MGLPLLDRCCCCCKLKTGVTVLAVLSLIAVIINLINLATGIETEILRKGYRALHYDEYLIDNIVIATTTIGVIENLFQACVTILLIHGIRKDKSVYMKPYLIWGLVHLSLMAIYFITMAIVFSENLVLVQSFLGTMFFVVIIQLYFIWVVYSYMKTVETETGPGNIKMRDNY